MTIQQNSHRILMTLGAMTALLFFVPGYSTAAPPEIKHVFVIVLENEGYDDTFGPQSQAPYLSKILPAQGALLSQYFGTMHNSLGNYIAMISGQAATHETHIDCPVFADFKLSGMAPDGQAIGNGCVYPANIKTLPDQMKTAGLRWKGYMEDMGNDLHREAATCAHPAPNTTDRTQGAEAPSAAMPQGDQYATKHNPFVYFHSITDSADCALNVVRLEQLTSDLQTIASTPNFAFISPNLCHDAHDEPCKNGEPGGLVSADAFLKKWVPRITDSPAFKQDGLLIITFDEGDYHSVKTKPGGGKLLTFTGETCCNQQTGPNFGSYPQTETSRMKTIVFENFGGDRTGAVALSPFIQAGTVSTIPYNHYSFLKSLEDLFHLNGYLGYAGQAGLRGFGSDIFNRKPSE